MTATQIRPAAGLSPLVAGLREPVGAHADWNEERAEEWWRKLVQPIPGPAEAAAEAEPPATS